MIIYGFPTTGKTTFLNSVAKKYPRLACIDSDSLAQTFFPEIWNENNEARAELFQTELYVNVIDNIIESSPTCLFLTNVPQHLSIKSPANLAVFRADVSRVHQAMVTRSTTLSEHQKLARDFPVFTLLDWTLGGVRLMFEKNLAKYVAILDKDQYLSDLVDLSGSFPEIVQAQVIACKKSYDVKTIYKYLLDINAKYITRAELKKLSEEYGVRYEHNN